VSYKYLSGRQQYNVDSLTLDAEECDDEVVQSMSLGSARVVFLVA
jgi:hypothetical protein